MDIFLIIGATGGVLFLVLCVGLSWLSYEDGQEELQRTQKLKGGK